MAAFINQAQCKKPDRLLKTPCPPCLHTATLCSPTQLQKKLSYQNKTWPIV